MHGGGQENKYRSGTENLPAICGFAKAAEIIHDRMEENRRRVTEIKNTVLQGLREEFGDRFHVNSPEDAYEGILNIAFPRVKAQVLMHHLETRNIIVSTGSACSSRKNVQSHVLTAMNLSKERTEGAIRLSFSGMNTVDEAVEFVQAVREIVPEIRY